MNTKHEMTREGFIALLGSAIPDEEKRAQLIQAAKALIAGDAALRRLKDLTSKQVYNGQLAYREQHPDCERGRPSIPELVRWLMEEGAVDRAQDFEDRLKKIHTLLMNSGMIDQETPIVMSFMDMLYARSLSFMD
jgi:hypothetical protein